MLSEANSCSCFPNVSQGLKMHPAVTESFASSSVEVSGGRETHSDSLLYNISVMEEKFHQVQGLVGVLISPDRNQQQPESTSVAMANMGSLVQEIISTASTILFTCQQMTHVHGAIDGGNFYSGETFENWYGENYYNCNPSDDHHNRASITTMNASSGIRVLETNHGSSEVANSSQNCDIIELDAANLLAKYTHYCQVCGKGFKRDANLRMHMRAHGDEYKTSAALTNPLKNINGSNAAAAVKFPGWKYSCPQEGCRWNQKHAKFQPLKSMVCVKNHYRRSHCPKMYVCKRCNRKQFSVPSDLRTHEKHCGQLKWQCSCGTTFSRKDKLMGHVALFVGHTPQLVGISTTATTSTKPNS